MTSRLLLPYLAFDMFSLFIQSFEDRTASNGIEHIELVDGNFSIDTRDSAI